MSARQQEKLKQAIYHWILELRPASIGEICYFMQEDFGIENLREQVKFRLEKLAENGILVITQVGKCVRYGPRDREKLIWLLNERVRYLNAERRRSLRESKFLELFRPSFSMDELSGLTNAAEGLKADLETLVADNILATTISADGQVRYIIDWRKPEQFLRRSLAEEERQHQITRKRLSEED